MAFIKPAIDPLEHEKLKIERRRERDADRTKRILHAKTRLYGIDTNSLKQQVEEKQERERKEMERDLYYDDMTVAHARMIEQQFRLTEMEKRKQREELGFFWKDQEKERRRRQLLEESGLSNVQDFDTTFLKFHGEDPDKEARTRAQQQQQRDWLAAQIEIQKNKEAQARAQDADYHAVQQRILDIQNETQRLQALKKQAEQEALANFHQTQAKEKKTRELRDSQLNQQADDKELNYALNSRFLNEVGSTREPASFKGFTTAQRQAILDQQWQQQQELKAKREQEKQDEEEYFLQQETIRRTIVQADREREMMKRQALMTLRDERSQQAREQQLRRQYMNNVVFTNPVKEEFFQQFGRSCR